MPIPSNEALLACVDADNTRALALCILVEAEGEPYIGKVAVGWSVLNRVNWKGRYPNNVKGVILQKNQYEGMGTNRLKALTAPDHYNPTVWGECLRAASAVLCGAEPDPVAGCTHYVTTALLNSPAAPSWAKLPGIFSTVVGRHTFFRSKKL